LQVTANVIPVYFSSLEFEESLEFSIEMFCHINEWLKLLGFFLYEDK